MGWLFFIIGSLSMEGDGGGCGGCWEGVGRAFGGCWEAEGVGVLGGRWKGVGRVMGGRWRVVRVGPGLGIQNMHNYAEICKICIFLKMPKKHFSRHFR